MERIYGWDQKMSKAIIEYGMRETCENLSLAIFICVGENRQTVLRKCGVAK